MAAGSARSARCSHRAATTAGRSRYSTDATGHIDPSVARYSEAHFDIMRTLRDNWKTLGPKLRGKLHVVVGSWDTFSSSAA